MGDGVFRYPERKHGNKIKKCPFADIENLLDNPPHLIVQASIPPTSIPHTPSTFSTVPAHHQTKSYAGKEQIVRSKTSSTAHLFVHCFTCRNHYRSYHRILQNAVVTNRMKTCYIFYYFIFTRKKNRHD